MFNIQVVVDNIFVCYTAKVVLLWLLFSINDSVTVVARSK